MAASLRADPIVENSTTRKEQMNSQMLRKVTVLTSLALLTSLTLAGCTSASAGSPANEPQTEPQTSSRSEPSEAAKVEFSKLSKDDAAESCVTLFGSPDQLVQFAGVEGDFGNATSFEEQWGTVEVGSQSGTHLTCFAGVHTGSDGEVSGEAYSNYLEIFMAIESPEYEGAQRRCPSPDHPEYFWNVCVIDGDKRVQLNLGGQNPREFTRDEYETIRSKVEKEVLPAIGW